MNKSKFTKLLAKRVDGSCGNCRADMQEIIEAMKTGQRINLFLEPDKNSHGNVMYWHINLKRN